MSDEQEIGRRLAESFRAQAHASVGDRVPIPPLRRDRAAGDPRRRLVRVLAPIAAAAAVAAVAITIAANVGTGHRQAGPPLAGSVTSPAVHRSSNASATLASVQVKLGMPDGERVGVGMPVVAYFSRAVTDARALQRLTSVTVDGKPVQADWYFAPNTGMAGFPVQGHLRMQSYWPAHAAIVVSAPVAGVSAGGGTAFTQDLSLHFSTGAATIATVDDSTHVMTVIEDGRSMGTYPVSLGATTTPTMKGTKVVMDKGTPVCLSGPGYSSCNVKFTQRLTTTGEYLLAATWNVGNIESGIDSSNGCTNLMPNDAEKLYGMLEVGDVIDYPNASGANMTFTDGLGDWNVPWALWMTGGSAPTH